MCEGVDCLAIGDKAFMWMDENYPPKNLIYLRIKKPPTLPVIEPDNANSQFDVSFTETALLYMFYFAFDRQRILVNCHLKSLILCKWRFQAAADELNICLYHVICSEAPLWHAGNETLIQQDQRLAAALHQGLMVLLAAQVAMNFPNLSIWLCCSM